jgi:4-amino-4-deoxy-L-arabinose transferase-like glycosyltransferase
MPLKRYDRYDGLISTLCFILSLALYLRTLTPGLLHGDSGEFQTLAYLLGHTHPTGYPVYLVLAKMATTLPLGDVAYRVNLFSALMAALTVTGVYLSGRLLVKYRIIAFIGAMALAISPTFWSQAVIAEVYTPGSAFLILILLVLLWWDQTKKPLTLYLAGLLCGLSLGVHMSAVLLAPAILLFLILHWRRGARMWGTALAGAMTGVLITVTVFWLMDLHNPTANYFNSVIEPSRTAWGLSTNEIDGPLERLFFGWSARQFHSFMFAGTICHSNWGTP